MKWTLMKDERTEKGKPVTVIYELNEPRKGTVAPPIDITHFFSEEKGEHIPIAHTYIHLNFSNQQIRIARNTYIPTELIFDIRFFFFPETARYDKLEYNTYAFPKDNSDPSKWLADIVEPINNLMERKGWKPAFSMERLLGSADFNYDEDAFDEGDLIASLVYKPPQTTSLHETLSTFPTMSEIEEVLREWKVNLEGVLRDWADSVTYIEALYVRLEVTPIVNFTVDQKSHRGESSRLMLWREEMRNWDKRKWLLYLTFFPTGEVGGIDIGEVYIDFLGDPGSVTLEVVDPEGKIIWKDSD